MTDYTIPRANAPIAGTEPPSTQWYNFIRYLDSRSSSATGDVQAEITVIAEKLGSPDGTVDNIPPLGNVTSVQGKQSIASSGIGVVQLRLVNDVETVDSVSFYGTDSAGVKGWNLLYDAFADTDNIFKINTDGIVSFDLTDLSDSGTGALLATTFDAKGRKTGTKAATITGTAGRITVANGDAVAGLPTIDLATLSDSGGGALLGFSRDAYGRVSGTHAITITGTANQVTVAGGTGTGASITLGTPQDIAATSTPSFAQVALSADPTTALQAATKQYVDSVAAGLSPKAPTLLATTTNDTLTGLAARDGITPVAGSRVLVKNQTLPAQNGIYIASASAWARATDMATWAQVPSAYLWVEEGTVNADTGWVCTSDPSGVIGVTSITFVQFGGNGTVTAGTGITVSGNQVSLANTAVTPASYGDATHVATFTVDQQGRLTAASTSGSAVEPAITAGTTAQYWRGDKSFQTLDKTAIGLGNVDNTSDANKPVSTAQNAADILNVPLDGTRTMIGDLSIAPSGAGSNIFLYASASGQQNRFVGNVAGNRRWLLQFGDGVPETGSNAGSNFSLYSCADSGALLKNTLQCFRATGDVAPGTDNTQKLGTSALRWSVVYAATGAINTSDAREKSDVAPLNSDELAAAAELARAPGTYQWLSAMQAKGADARLHVGLTVQRAIEIMQLHGLDPFDYGFICHDQWDELPEVVDTETGEITQAYRPAGDRYSFRHDELLLFIARGFAARLDALESA